MRTESFKHGRKVQRFPAARGKHGEFERAVEQDVHLDLS